MNQPKPKRGCLFYGCLTFTLVFIGVAIGSWFGTKKAIEEVVKNYTAQSPAPLPSTLLSLEEKRAIASRIQREALEAAQAGSGASSLQLDETELNVLLSEAPKLTSFTNQVYLKPESNFVRADLSLPLDQFENWRKLTTRFGEKLKGRYFNGVAYLQPGVTNGQLFLTIEKLMVNNAELPTAFVERLRAQNLAEIANQNAEFTTFLQKVQGVQVTNNQVEIRFKP